jgi:hypothetical protein
MILHGTGTFVDRRCECGDAMIEDRMIVRISKSLHVSATRRAARLGFSAVDGYVADLIRHDVGKTSKRTADNSPPKEFLRGKLFPVKPAKSQGKLNRRSIMALRKEVLDSMFSYMKASEDSGYGYACGYQMKHIDRCASITRDFLNRLSAIPKREASSRVIEEVERLVLKLNKLNQSCDGALIETDQRELLCQFVFAAARIAGLTVTRDITEQWRSW